jgi:DNA-directed RNA polymerase subunit H
MGLDLTPEHLILSDAQAKRELKRLGIPKEKLPLIAYADAAIQALVKQGKSISVGDVVRITRKSKTVGESYYYRQVVI